MLLEQAQHGPLTQPEVRFAVLPLGWRNGNAQLSSPPKEKSGVLQPRGPPGDKSEEEKSSLNQAGLWRAPTGTRRWP